MEVGHEQTKQTQSEIHLDSLVPTKETQAKEFLEKFPEADGRGIKIAIFDTGVDPGVAGLLKTAEGKPKIIDLIDGTGSGDVATNVVVTADKEGYIKALSGRKLKVNPEWKNPSGFYHVGIKLAFDLYSGVVKKRIKAERAEIFEKKHQQFMALINSQEFNTEHDAKYEKDKKKFVDYMKKQYKKHEDPGPLLDCVVYHDGEDYHAIVVHEDNEADLAGYEPMTDYRKKFQYARISDQDMLNYSVNIYEEGKRLSIVANGSSHGTHVAGIVGAYYEENPELNGVAPGAQLVSVKIGDTRLGTMETGKGIIRGLAHAKEIGCHLINMSYGESADRPNSGRIIKLIDELVHEHNMVFVSSAGNAGPALSTVGAPGGTTSSVIGVGAQVSSDMMDAQYGMRENLPYNQYTWSSRGPSFDGALGVSISAPGASISPVPESTLMKNHRKNGTSMSSPNACGCIALLLSYMKGLNRTWNAAYIKRVVQNTAKIMENIHPLAQGYGLIQVVEAANYMMQYRYEQEYNMHYKVVCARSGKPGIYLRTAEETSKVWDEPIEVEPVFSKSCPNQNKVTFEKRFTLVSNQPWIKIPSFLHLPNASNTFQVLIDPTVLKEESTIYMGEIVGIDQSQPEAGPAFRLPITVVKPKPAPIKEYDIVLEPGSIHRTFVAIPFGMTYAEVSLTSLHHYPSSRRTLMIHALCPHPHKSSDATSYKKYLFLNEGNESHHNIPVVQGSTLEVCVAQNWNALGSTHLRATVRLFGAGVNQSPIVITNSTASIDLYGIQNEQLEFNATYSHASKTIRPNSNKLKCSNSKRDQLFNNRFCHDLYLEYKLNLEAAGKTLLRLPGISTCMYDNAFDAYMIQVHDKQKKTVAVFDYKSSYQYLAKGNYVVRLHLRHDNMALLQRKTSICIQVLQELPSKLSSNFYPTNEKAVRRAGKINRTSIAKGQIARVFMTHPSISKIKHIKEGWIVHGKFTAFPHSSVGTPVVYHVPPKPIKDDSSSKRSKTEEKDTKTTMEELEEALLLKKVAFAESIMKKKKDDFLVILDQLLKESPNHLKVLELQLNFLERQSKKKFKKIVDVCDKIAQVIDRDALAIFFGRMPKVVDEEDHEFEAKKKKMNGIKDSLANAYYQKLLAIISKIEKLKKNLKGKDDKKEEEDDDDDQPQNGPKRAIGPKTKIKYFKKDLTTTWKLLTEQVNTISTTYIVGHVKYHYLNDLVGEALTALQKIRNDKAGEDIDAELADLQLSIYEDLHIDCWVKHVKASNIINKPREYSLF